MNSAWLIGVCVVAQGCMTAPPWDVEEFLQSHEYAASGSASKAYPGDVISIESPHVLEVDGTAESVGRDGNINLDLLGDVQVAGLTAREIKHKLEIQLSPYYSDPRLRVRLGGDDNQRIYVFGQVSRAGPRTYTGRDTLFDVLMEAQPTFLAWTSEIRVIRSSPEPGASRVVKVDFEKMYQKGDMRLNVLLQEGDIVYVPPTVLAWMGLRLRELLFPVTPVLEAYDAPAEIKATNDVYNDDDDGNSGRRSLLLRR